MMHPCRVERGGTLAHIFLNWGWGSGCSSQSKRMLNLCGEVGHRAVIVLLPASPKGPLRDTSS